MSASIQRDMHDLSKKMEYVNELSRLHPAKIKFVGNKKLKCPFRGEEYFVTLFSGMDRERSPLRFYVGHGGIDSGLFQREVRLAVEDGWLRPWDVLVMNNWRVQTGGENDILEELLWESFRIYVHLLPPRTPDWSPINAIWKDATKRIPHHPYQRHSIRSAAECVLGSYTRREIELFHIDCYSKCGL